MVIQALMWLFVALLAADNRSLRRRVENHQAALRKVEEWMEQADESIDASIASVHTLTADDVTGGKLPCNFASFQD